MAAAVPFLPYISAAMTVIGGISSANAQRDAGERQSQEYEAYAQRQQAAGVAAQQRAQYEAKQLQTQAGQAEATAQREALQERHKANLLASRALAVAAASGGGTGGSAGQLMAGITNAGNLNVANSLYVGEDRSANMQHQAALKNYDGDLAFNDSQNAAAQSRRSGEIALEAGKTNARNTLIGSIGSAAMAYGGTKDFISKYASGPAPGIPTSGVGYMAPSNGGMGGDPWSRW